MASENPRRERPVPGPPAAGRGLGRVLAGAAAIQAVFGQVAALPVVIDALERRFAGGTGPALDAHAFALDARALALAALLGGALAVFVLVTILLGPRVERAPPRRALFIAAATLAAGLIVAGIGAHLNSRALMLLGYAGLAGLGLGIGEVAQLGCLLDTLPGRRSLALGLCLGAFGAGMLLAAPVWHELLLHFRSPASGGVMEAMATLGVIDFMIVAAALGADRRASAGAAH